MTFTPIQVSPEATNFAEELNSVGNDVTGMIRFIGFGTIALIVVALVVIAIVVSKEKKKKD